MNVHQELISIFIMTTGVLLWPLGGFRWKGFRRIFLPICMSGLLYWYGLSYWQCLLSGGLLSVAAYLGYGVDTPWWKPFQKINGKLRSSKLLTACSYILPALVIGYTWWFLITPALFLITFYLSNTKVFGKDFSWKICEAIMGLMVTATIIAALQRRFL